ncbi:MAG: tetratricopeptide repeat protein [Bacteroidota bacterium]
MLPVVFGTCLCTAQTIDAITKLRLAQSFEQAAEYERAVALYEELYAGDSTNYVTFDGLRRGYVQLKQYEKAIRLLHQRLGQQPNDVQLLAGLGGLYYEMGEEQRADSLWRSILAMSSGTIGYYRVVASQMMEHRLYEQAIQVFLSARLATGNESVFAEDLATLYSALQQYGAATREYVRMVKAAPAQLPYVQSRISSYTIQSEGLTAASGVVSAEVKQAPNDIALRRLYAWLSMEEKDIRAAYGEYQIIDKLSNANGAEIYAFAQRASQEHAYRVAAQAFREVVENHPNPAILPGARFGFARATEELSLETDTSAGPPPESLQKIASGPVSETRPGFQNAIALYEQIVAEYPNTELALQSMFQIGMIRFTRFFDLDGALKAFGLARQPIPGTTIPYEAILKTGEVLVARNNLERARTEFDAIGKVSLVPYQEKAAFKLAEIDYFEGLFDSSLSKLERFSTSVNGDLANDALGLRYFIQENKSPAPRALEEFAKADLLARQRKYSEALAAFADIVATHPDALLVDDAMMRVAELQLLLKETDRALATFLRIVDLKMSILKDKAQLRIAETYRNILKDKTKALEAYERLLAKYPHSLYAEEARKRIRLLRGDPI